MYMSIHHNESYVNFQYEFNVVSGVVLSSYIVVLVTIPLVFRMCWKFAKQKSNSPEFLHKHLLFSFMLMEISSFLFVVLDNLTFGFPSTGILTAYFATWEPSELLKWVYFMQLQTNYWSMMFSMLFCLTRLLIVFCPDKHAKIWCWLSIFYSLLTVTIPIKFEWFMIPALGYFRQYPEPYPIGAVFISFYGTTDNIRTDVFHFPFSIGVPIAIIAMNVVLRFKVKATVSNANKALQSRNSRFSSTQETSLKITTIAITLPFLTNGSMTLASAFFRDYVSYVVMVRQPINALGTCMVPWIFYLTHPLFSKKPKVLPTNSRT